MNPLQSSTVPMNVNPHSLPQLSRSCCFPSRTPSPLKFSHSRRGFLVSFLTAGLLSMTQDAQAGMEKYMKKRKLDPLETYVPGIILCESQFHELETKLLAEKVEYQDARSLLRSGPAGSLRSNIRAVAEYAVESGDGPAASDAVKLCLRSLEDLDSMLLRASRDDKSITAEAMKAKLGMSLQALDRLLQTVPGPILEKSKAVVDEFLEDTITEEVEDASVTDIESFIPSK